MRSRGRDLAIRLIVLATALLTVYAATRVDWGEVWEGLRTSNPLWVVLALIVIVPATFIRALRWRALFPLDARPPAGAVTRALALCIFFNIALPARAGEPVRVFALARETQRRPSEVVATIVVDRLFDTIVLLAMLAAALPWLPQLEWEGSIWIAMGIVGAVVVLFSAIALGGERALARLLSPLGLLPRLGAGRVQQVAHSLSHGLSGLRDARLAVEALAWTVASWTAVTFATWLLMLAFDIHLSLLAALLVVVAVSLINVLPTLPGNLGPFEGAVVVALRPFDVDAATALSYALVLHVINHLPFLLLGAPLVRHQAELWRIGRTGRLDEAEAT